ncbi:MAG TPA: hypothetical protein VHD91_11280 [Gaiellaceae bacterium]|nr:hypothetical protein [Gaiellaceae bacterium]
MKKFFEFGGVAAGIVLIAFGVAAIVLGVNGKNTVGTELKLQQIVGSADMTPAGIKAEAAQAGLTNVTNWPTCSVANEAVTNGARARCFAEYMRIHALEATHGVVYANMGRYEAKAGTPKSQLTADGATNNTDYAVIDPNSKQPVDNGARNLWVTETALTSALNSAYMAEQLGNFGIVVGIALLLSGFGFVILALGGALRATGWVVKGFRSKQDPKPNTTAPLSA